MNVTINETIEDTVSYNVEYVVNTSIEIQVDAINIKEAKKLAKQRLMEELSNIDESDVKIVVTED
jgi:hypothetical protein